MAGCGLVKVPTIHISLFRHETLASVRVVRLSPLAAVLQQQLGHTGDHHDTWQHVCTCAVQTCALALHLSGKQPTRSVRVRLVVRQQRRGEVGGVVAVVRRDPVQRVRQLRAGLVHAAGGDEGRGSAGHGRGLVRHEGPGHAGGGGDLLQARREDERRPAEVAAAECEGLGLDGGLHRGVGRDLEPGRRVQTS